MQTWYSTGTATPHPDPVEYQSAIQHLHANGTPRATRLVTCVAPHDERKHRKNQGLGSAIGVQDANFILIPVLPKEILVADSVRAQCEYKALAEEGVVLGVVVRYQGSKSCCPGVCTVGTEEDNKIALEKLKTGQSTRLQVSSDRAAECTTSGCSY
ncbi:hypothetical protein EDB85DRAFT_2272680 [Lactarius pseudohatsudake]|nr:hypothetical protein EDB85DRAFT_2272680 [Lactarius pseudohatsudake]